MPTHAVGRNTALDGPEPAMTARKPKPCTAQCDGCRARRRRWNRACGSGPTLPASTVSTASACTKPGTSRAIRPTRRCWARWPKACGAQRNSIDSKTPVYAFGRELHNLRPTGRCQLGDTPTEPFWRHHGVVAGGHQTRWPSSMVAMVPCWLIEESYTSGAMAIWGSP